MQTVQLTIDGMSCGHCVARVRRALEALPEVRADDVQIGSARVAYDSDVITVDRITDAIREAGYEASPGEPRAA